MAETDWYETERNTEALIKAVVTQRDIQSLSGDDIWRILQLTWITASKGHVTSDHWKKLKLPALAHLFREDITVFEDLQGTLDRLNLPRSVANTAAKKTGFVNTYRAYRNSLRGWCQQNVKRLRPILDSACKLKSNDQERVDLASQIALLPRVSTPNGKRTMAASSHITPLVACLDPKRKFPIINGEAGVSQKLKRLGLFHSSLEEQVRGFLGLIGQFGLVDAFAVDTMTETAIQRITNRAKQRTNIGNTVGKGAPLPIFDEDERKALIECNTVVYRQLHNKMTNRLERLFRRHKISQGTSPDCRYDVLITNYDSSGRDLLVEAKPDTDKGSIRVAIGQLLDYRRFLPNQAATDLAILTITPPSASHKELMHDLQITALWFADDSCLTLNGDGKSWKTLKARVDV